jgi:bifunctional non-homologous end joining protein LigD
MRYIAPATPTLRPTPPRGERWLHEVKFDGWRVQLHKSERGAAVFTKGGHDYTRRFPAIAGTLMTVPARACILDGELVAPDDQGRPDFRALHFHDRDEQVCVWAFDLLHLDGEDLRDRSLDARKRALERLILKTGDNALRLSESFDDGVKLLAAAEGMRLEGVVSKRRDAPYRSGKKCDWIKVKCLSWRAANRERWRLFERR